MKSTATIGIGEAAARFGLATHVLRHWESVGLLTPARVAGDRRRYGPDDLFRVAVILRAKEAGLGLDEIREMIATRAASERREILRRRQAELRRRIEQARAALEVLECALGCDHDDFTGCAHFQQAVRDRMGLPGLPAPEAR
ncbi:MAG: MerR family transcriptional regulator [Microbispora sp.]|nr:MerR family transcriptional regulator [Microbispora sp.]